VLLGQIEAFVEIVRLGTVLRAAEALCITQPALTARVQGLERELGQRLFARSGRGLRLTDAGRAFLPFAQHALRAVADGRVAVEDVATGRTGTLVLGATGSVSNYFLPRVIKQFRAAQPRVELVVRTGHSEQMLELVLSQAVELAIVRELQHHDIEVIRLYEDELTLVTHPTHRFARRGLATLAEVGYEGLVLFDRASSYYTLTQSLFAKADVAPRTVMEVDNFEAAKKMLEEGLGVALLPKVAVAQEVADGRLAEVKIADAGRMHRQMVAIRRADVGQPGGIVRSFLKLLRETTAEPASPAELVV
jgi:DNA-binding transcriptional LysR family regulator